MTADWYEDAVGFILRRYENSGTDRVSGVELLIEYFLERQPSLLQDYSDGSDSEGAADLYAKESIEGFEEWLKENKSHLVRVGRRYNWYSISGSESRADDDMVEKRTIDLGPEFTSDEQRILEVNISDLSAKDKLFADALYEKLLGLNDSVRIAKAALRIAVVYEKCELGYHEKTGKWVECGDKEKVIKKRGVYKRYKHAAVLAALSLDHKLAGECYLKAVDAFDAFDDNSSGEALDLIRCSRREYELAGVDDKAALLYKRECDERRKQSSFFEGLTLCLYKTLSSYGESPARVFCWAVVVVLVCSVVYFFCGVHASGDYIATLELSELMLEKIGSNVAYDTVGYWESFKVSLYYSVVTFTTLGYGDFSPSSTVVRTVSALQAVSGLLLSSLFMVTVVRKYSR